MAKPEQRLQDLPTLPEPGWFAPLPMTATAVEADHWDWLAGGGCSVEVTEFAVSDRFIEALFGCLPVRPWPAEPRDRLK